MTRYTVECVVCHGSFVAARSDARTCSARCRQRQRRGTYVVTEEDRAAIDRVLADDSDLPPRLSAEQTRAWVLAARRNEDA